jgi:hypothetical protein
MASAQASVVFGQTVGRRLRDLLYPGAGSNDVEVQALEEWIPIAFEAKPEEWAEVAAFAPKIAILRHPRSGQMQWLSLEFEPIRQEGKVARMMLLATDETEVHRLEQAVRTQEEEHARQMARMRRLLTGGGQVFVSFLNGAEQRLERSVSVLEAMPVRPTPLEEATTIHELFGLVHTVKGEANAFGLGELAIQACVVEDALDALASRSRSGKSGRLLEERRALRDGIEKTRDALGEARSLFVEASPIGKAILDQITVRRTDVEAILTLTRGRSDEVGRLALRLASRPFSECVATRGE